MFEKFSIKFLSWIKIENERKKKLYDEKVKKISDKDKKSNLKQEKDKSPKSKYQILSDQK